MGFQKINVSEQCAETLLQLKWTKNHFKVEVQCMRELLGQMREL